MKFTKLKISGFKSFVDPTFLEIKSGLTGIVGPNGCGKSNIVEAIKWNMGESGPSNLRAGEMEDVIFSGTKTRAPRNFAEVTISVESDSINSTNKPKQRPRTRSTTIFMLAISLCIKKTCPPLPVSKLTASLTTSSE